MGLSQSSNGIIIRNAVKRQVLWHILLRQKSSQQACEFRCSGWQWINSAGKHLLPKQEIWHVSLPWAFIWSWLNQLHGEEHSSVSVTVYLILALLGLPRTYQLLLTVRGHWHLFLGNCGDVTKPIFVQIMKKLLVLLIKTWKTSFSVTACFTVVFQLGFVGFVCGHRYITLKSYNQSDMYVVMVRNPETLFSELERAVYVGQRSKISAIHWVCTLSIYAQDWIWSLKQVHFCWYMKLETESTEGKQIQN